MLMHMFTTDDAVARCLFLNKQYSVGYQIELWNFHRFPVDMQL